MTAKTWTATDLELGPLKIARKGDVIHVERRYSFVDINGDALSQVSGGRFVADIAVAELPIEVVDALQSIDAWTKSQAIAQEDMA